MLEESMLGDGWHVWAAEEERAILAYRPDVFDGSAFPAPCMPTLYVTRGRLNRRPEGNRNLPPDAPWLVTLYLEPDVSADPESYEGFEEALAGAAELSRQFADGEIDYRDLYQVPRLEYFERLDELTGRRA